MKKLLILLSILVITSLSFGQVTPFDKVTQAGSSGSDYSYDICVDKAGNKYITGKYKGTIDFGRGVSITPVDNYDIFVAKYNADSEIQWAKSYGGISADEGNAVTVDNHGNVIVAGVFFSSINNGADTLFGQGSFDIFVLKLDSDGNHLWMKQGATENYDKPTDIKVDSEGNYILLGYYDVNDSLTLPFVYEGLELTTSQGERDVLVIKMDSDGNPLWGVTGGGADNDYSSGLVLDENDDIYFTGNYDNEEALFGTTTLPNIDGYEVFIAKVNSMGTYEWAVAATGPGDAKGYGIDFLPIDGESGIVLATGYFEDSLYIGLDNQLLESVGDDDIYILSYNADGTFDGGSSYGSTGEDQAKAINIVPGSDGYYYVSGITKGDFVTPTDSLVNYGDRDMFVLKMRYDELVWVKNYGGSAYDYINAADIARTGKVYFTGNHKSTPAQFDPFTTDIVGSYDLWIGEMFYVTPPSAPVILAVEDIPNDQGGKVRVQFTGSELTKSFSIWRLIDGSGDWDAVGSFNGIFNSKYSYVAPTLGDSTDQGIYLSTFKITAHSGESIDYFESDLASGYSIDNLAPAVPAGIIAIGHEDRVEIAWDDNEDKDFQFYAIYRSSDSEFNPDTMITATYTTIESSFDDTSVEFGKTYYYRIVTVDFSGNQSEYSENIFALVTDVNTELELPTVYELGQNYPNPFNPSTVINFSLPESGLVTLKVFDILGQEVAELVNQVKTAGVYEVSFDATNLTTGLYIYRIEAGSFSATKKMLLVK